MECSSTYSTFRSFAPHFDALARVGYFKMVMKNPSNIQLILHHCYRAFIWFIVLSYNLQQLVRMIQTRDSTDGMVDTLFILLTTINTLGKQLAFNARVWRIDRIIDVINGPLFAAKNQDQVEMMKLNEKAMVRLLYFFQSMVITGCIMHATYPMINRALGQEVSSYFSLETSRSVTFELVAWCLSVTLTIQAYGNSTMDCTIAGFYSMAKVQLQVLRYNLEHLVDPDESGASGCHVESGKFRFKDSKVIQNRLKHCVRHHLQIKWLVKEVESIFCEAMSVQFLIMALVICMTVYKIVGLTASSAEFWMVFVYLKCMLAQLFIYCYFGTQLKFESEFIAQSAYYGSWTQLSPAPRRQLVILMQCARPIVPCAAKIVPVSLETYIAVLRASYTLFTILDKQ